MSAKGCAAHTPFNPKYFGTISINGINTITCLNKLSIIDFFALPIDWK